MIGSRNALGFLGVPEIGNPTVLPAAAPGFVGERPNGKIARPGMGGIFDRIGDKLKEPGMSAALLRGAAASFNGQGLGGAIGAAGGYMDDFHQRKALADQRQFENDARLQTIGISQQQVDQTGAHLERNDANEVARNAALGDYNRERLNDFDESRELARQRVGQQAAQFSQREGRIASNAGRRSASGKIVRVSSLQEALALPVGTAFETPDGRRKMR